MNKDKPHHPTGLVAIGVLATATMYTLCRAVLRLHHETTLLFTAATAAASVLMVGIGWLSVRGGATTDTAIRRAGYFSLIATGAVGTLYGLWVARHNVPILLPMGVIVPGAVAMLIGLRLLIRFEASLRASRENEGRRQDHET